MKIIRILVLLVLGIVLLTGVTVNHSYGQEKESIVKFVTTFIDDFNSPNWAENVKNKYHWNDEGIKEQKLFRESFANFNIKIKHLIVDGDHVVMWGEMSATYVKEYPRGEFVGYMPQNKSVTWNEIWYFTVKNGEFGNEWDWAIDGVPRMKQMGIKCLPDGF